VSGPTVSVGLPVFNGERYLEEAIWSILTQTYDDLELIIADNASTDTTQEICVRIAAQDPRIRYYRNESNLGAARNYNITLEHANGTYFKWFAHDDVCAPDFIRVCVEALEKDADIVLAYPTPIDIDENGDVIGPRDAGLHFDDPNPVQRFRDTMRKGHACLPVFGLTRTDVLRRTGQHGNYPSADRVLLSELALWGKLSEIPEELYLHREHAERFVYTHVTAQEQAEWFDPGTAQKASHTTWKKFGEYIKAINRSPISLQQKAACYARIGKWSVKMRGPLTDEVGRSVKRR